MHDSRHAHPLLSLLLLCSLSRHADAYELIDYFTGYGGRPLRAAYAIHAQNLSQVQHEVTVAAAANLKVRVLGSGWSWTDYFIDDAVYLRLTGGELTSFELGQGVDGSSLITAGGGTQFFSISVFLRERGLQLEARGNCMNANMSQTVGGLLATNVHHDGIRSFADITRWVDVVLANGTLVRSYRGEELFMLTIGGGGQTGIIVRACFDVVQRQVWRRSFLHLLWTPWTRREPMQLINLLWVKTNVPYNAGTVGSIDWSTEEVERRQLMDIDGTISDTTSGRTLQAGMHYIEFEFFFPVSLRWSVARLLLGQGLSRPIRNWCSFGASAYVGLGVFRYVFRSQVYLAGNGYVGRTGPAAEEDFYSVTLSRYQQGSEDCLRRTFEALSDAFPGQIRVHPGKRHAIPLEHGVTPAVYELLDGYDPTGVFR
mmetsp:Transcript_26832/g.75173  ORF Transcript_26832/g.75173 Transcript_26832/m.75173 type:complete len:427 (-) Transcript_26832:137-1417(-)|eukprot:scaffold74586_cov28-Tisochrysis_lutea.AAC.1